jgi:hypothetical protein
MGEFGEYFGAVGLLWWGIVSAGGLFGVDEFLGRISPDAKAWLDRKLAPNKRRRIEYGIIVVAVFAAGFFTWQGEHRDRLKAEDKLAQVGVRQDRHLTADQKAKLSSALKPIAAPLTLSVVLLI